MTKIPAGQSFKRATIVLLLDLTAISSACAPNSIVGRWRVTQRYDRFEESWKPVDDLLTVEFARDGRYTSAVKGRLTDGTYSVDESVTPHRLVLTDEKSGQVNFIFRSEGAKLILKANKGTESPFPSSFDTGGQDDFELSEFERN